ncbi:MAG: TetR/AcrR family transcriptional regulator, partial [Chlorobiales bacterium]|nr:TetR/AcrR family transcriptional regulator [Chlorobiales bacterium]
LLDAFEKVLVRSGIRKLSVNSIVEAARVSKPLLYRYFGDLPGLVRTWAARRAFSRSQSGEGTETRIPIVDDGDFHRQIAGDLIASANALRSSPVTLELLAEELTANSDISEAFQEARGEQGRFFQKAMLTDERYVQPENRRLIIILYAAITYLAMRSRRSPRFMGLRLDTDEGWEEALEMVRGIVMQPGK